MEGSARKWHFSDESENTHVKGHRQGRVSRGAVSIWRPRGRAECMDGSSIVTIGTTWCGVHLESQPPGSGHEHCRSGTDVSIEIGTIAPRCIDQRRIPRPAVLHLRHYARNEDTNPIRPIVGNFETQRRPNCGFRLRAKRQSCRFTKMIADQGGSIAPRWGARSSTISGKSLGCLADLIRSARIDQNSPTGTSIHPGFRAHG
jgi:hypothetical protein